MVYDIEEFKNSLNNLNLSPTVKRLWVKQFNKNPEVACNNYFRKMELLYSGMRFWEIAKSIILKNTAPIPEPVPIVKDFQYFRDLNDGKWGDMMYDIEEYEMDMDLKI